MTVVVLLQFISSYPLCPLGKRLFLLFYSSVVLVVNEEDPPPPKVAYPDMLFPPPPAPPPPLPIMPSHVPVPRKCPSFSSLDPARREEIKSLKTWNFSAVQHFPLIYLSRAIQDRSIWGRLDERILVFLYRFLFSIS